MDSITINNQYGDMRFSASPRGSLFVTLKVGNARGSTLSTMILSKDEGIDLMEWLSQATA